MDDSLEVFLSTSNNLQEKRDIWSLICSNLKIGLFVVLWIICSCALMTNNVKVETVHQISVPKGLVKSYRILEQPIDNNIRVTLEGPFVPSYYSNLSSNWMSVWIQLIVVDQQLDRKEIVHLKPSQILLLLNVSDVWELPLVSKKLIDVVPSVVYRKTFQLNSIKVGNYSHGILEMKFRSNMKTNFPLSMGYNLQPIDTDYGIIYAALVLLGLYVMIIFDLLHRTLAALLASTMSVAILAVLHARPTMAEIISWIDVETLLLLFSMMTLVTILGETGIFDYMSVVAYRFTGGKTWPLINIMCIIAVVASCVLDNVTTILLFTPVTIKLCEVMKLKPVPVLIYILIFANIGGAITPIGDPPNVIIASNAAILEAGVHFGTFTLHMGVGSIVALVAAYVQMRYTNRDEDCFKDKEPAEVQGLRREIAVWRRTAASLSSYSRDEEVVKETIIKQSTTLLGKLHLTENNLCSNSEEKFAINLRNLENQFPIKDKVLLIKSGISLCLVICVFFLHSIPSMRILGLGWTALLGALLLLLLYDKDDIEGIFIRIEWATLLFFASLFILMEALSRLGLIEWVGRQTQIVIMSVGQESRLTVAIILILWVSAIASAFVDNLPLTTMMVRIATNLAENRELGLPLQPLIWALCFGGCFGGNGTLFGSSSNIVCAGIAEQHGYQIRFLEFSRISFPIMMVSMVLITFYLIVAHVFFCWH